jgi:hypothetical protein
MLSNRITAALFGAGALLAAGLATAPASAAPLASGGLPVAQAQGDLVQQAWHRGRPHYRGHRPHHYGRPVYRPRCFFQDRRVWNGHRWVVRPVRVCR